MVASACVFLVPLSLSLDSLAISTSNGEVAIWKRDPLQSEDGWSHVTTFSVEGVVNNIEVSEFRVFTNVQNECIFLT